MSKGAYAKGTLPGLNELFRRDEMSDTVNKELVEAIEAIEEEMCDDFSLQAQRINEQISRIRALLGITLPEGNEEENE